MKFQIRKSNLIALLLFSVITTSCFTGISKSVGTTHVNANTTSNENIKIEETAPETNYNVNQYGLKQEALINAVDTVPYLTGDQDLDDAVQEIIDASTNDYMSNYEKTIAIYLYIEQHYNYKYTRMKTNVKYISKQDKTIVEHAKSIAIKGSGDCYNFNALFTVCMRALGLECYVIEGTYKDNEHYWSEIIFDNDKYIFDPEADFRYYEGRGKITLLHFCINEEDDMYSNYKAKNEERDINAFNKFKVPINRTKPDYVKQSMSEV